MLPLMITAIENDDDRQLAAELYTRYRAVMLRRAGSILKEDDRAEEAVQEAMLRVIRHLEKVRMIPENERAYYLAAVTQTAALDLYRRRQREQQNTFTGYDESLDAPGPAEDGPMELLLCREQAVLLRQCVALLPQRELDILNYRYLLELPHKEIARLMGLKPEHVRMLLTRAKRKLLLAYREKGGTDDE